MPEAIAPGVHWLDLGSVNAYLVETDDGPVAIDAGMPGHVDEIHAAMRELGLDPAKLARVLVTHTDIDHVGGLAELVEGTPARIQLSQMAADLLTGAAKPPWLSSKGLFQRVFNLWVDPPPADRLEVVGDGEVVDGFTAVETPGHALGHVAFVHGELGICFAGDLVMTRGGPPARPPRVINYDTGQIAGSIAHLLEVAPPFEMVCAGHGDPVLEDGEAGMRRLT